MPSLMGQACTRCHSRKIKCDRNSPTCCQCSKAQSDCVYSERARRIDKSISEMEEKIKSLESTNAKLESTNENLSRQLKGQLTVPPSKKRAVDLDDVTSVASYLSLSVAGDTRYLGPSSGVIFAQIVSATIASATRKPAFPEFSPIHTPEIMLSEQPAQFYQNLRLQFDEGELSDGSYPGLNKLTAFKLISVYFGHTHILYPFLCRDECLEKFERIYNDPGFYSVDIFWAFVFDMVLAIASSTMQRNQNSIASIREPFHMRGLEKLPSVLRLDGMKSLVAILLLAVYSLMHDSSSGVWQLVGIGLRLCTELGLHRDDNGYVPLSDPKFFELEMRRRCFWSVFTLDRVVSVTSGRPLGINDSDIEVPLPSTHDDSCIYLHNSGRACTCPTTTCFIQVLRLRDITGKISRLFYSRRINSPTQTHIRLKKILRDKLELWRDEITELELSDLCYVSPGSSSCFTDISWYNMLYYNAIQLLNRPSLVFPELDEQDLLDVLEAARGSILIYSDLCKTRRLNYSWMTLHAVFMTGISYLYGIAKLMYKSMNKLPSSLAIYEDTRACSNVLTSISERWNSNQEAQSIFDRLSGLVVSEYLEQKVQQEVNSRADAAGDPVGNDNDFITKFGELEDIFEGNSKAKSNIPETSRDFRNLFMDIPEISELLD